MIGKREPRQRPEGSAGLAAFRSGAPRTACPFCRFADLTITGIRAKFNWSDQSDLREEIEVMTPDEITCRICGKPVAEVERKEILNKCKVTFSCGHHELTDKQVS